MAPRFPAFSVTCGAKRMRGAMPPSDFAFGVALASPPSSLSAALGFSEVSCFVVSPFFLMRSFNAIREKVLMPNLRKNFFDYRDAFFRKNNLLTAKHINNIQVLCAKSCNIRDIPCGARKIGVVLGKRKKHGREFLLLFLF